MGFRPTFFVGILVVLGNALARPGQLKEQRFEFQELHNEHVFSGPPASARLEAVPWSQQHPNEVNAFAEVFRQQYNQMVEHNNRMMQLHQQTMSNMFRPVAYELYQIPNGQSWNNFFGSQQHYVQHQAQQMTQQLAQDLQQGTVTQQDLMNPEFFVNQAASELDRVHQSHHVSETTEFQSNNEHQEFGEEQQYQGFESEHNQHDEQQQHQAVFAAEDQHSAHAVARDQYTEGGQIDQAVSLKKILVYNSETNSYEYVYVNSVDERAGQSDNQHTHHTSYIQNLPPVAFNNERVTHLDHEVEAIEVHTPSWVETPKANQPSVRTQEQEQSTIQISANEYYGSTYDQQPINDLRFLDNEATTKATPSYRVVSLDRKKANRNTTPQSTSTTTTNPTPTTESSVMSMLPHKKPALNYTEMYHKVREELNKHMQKEAETTNVETHFMGMTSNKEQTKLQYDTISKETVVSGERRGDQPSVGDDYVSEELVESEPGLGYYPVDTEAFPIIPTTTIKTFLSSTAKPVIINQNPYYEAPLAPFPTRKPEPNPYYSAPLAPFPESILPVSHDNHKPPHVQYAQFSEVDHMNQETQNFNHAGVTFTVADVVQDADVQQHHMEFSQHQFEEQFAHDYDDTQQFEMLQTAYIDQHTHSADFQQLKSPTEKFSSAPVVEPHHEEEVPGHVMELTTPVAVVSNSAKPGWFQKQWSKLKHTFQS